MASAVPLGRQLALLAARHGDRVAIVHVDPAGAEREISWRELDRRANQVARLLTEHGVTQGGWVVVALPNTPEHFFADLAAWRLGATVLPLRWDLPRWDRERLLELARPAAVVAAWDAAPEGTLSIDDVKASIALDDSAVEDRIANPVRAIATSGSTGQPKLIVNPVPGVTGGDAMIRMAETLESGEDTTELVISPIYHTNGFACLHHLLEGRRLVVMQKFDAALAVDLIERHRVNFAIMVPTMLQRIAALPGVQERDFSSVEFLHYGGAPIPEWVVHKWFGLVGPERFIFSYGGTEGIGLTMARGDEWLNHRGTVGSPVGCDVKIIGEDGQRVPPGSIGRILMRHNDGSTPCTYVGAEFAVDGEGFATLGDLGWLDEDGYLFIADRRSDMIVTGGANVFPAEVELALAEHRGVADCVVVGIADAEWGQRVHAIVEPADPADPPTAEALRTHVRERLAAYKVPKTVEIVDRIPRNDAGKLSRAALAGARSPAV
ncbi:MAG: bile acid-coenzyme ligase [Mycobacterium sp.]|nr:bile acid-coenzyme ligase [Mycobacterium sp.]